MSRIGVGKGGREEGTMGVSPDRNGLEDIHHATLFARHRFHPPRHFGHPEPKRALLLSQVWEKTLLTSHRSPS